MHKYSPISHIFIALKAARIRARLTKNVSNTQNIYGFCVKCTRKNDSLGIVNKNATKVNYFSKKC